MNPNNFAWAALSVWPILVVAIFSFMPAPRACVLSLIAAEMFLPASVSLDLPFIPPLDKGAIGVLSALAACLIFEHRLLVCKPIVGIYELALIPIVLGALGTTLTNREVLTYGPIQLPGQTLKDFGSDTIVLLLHIWLPFFLGRKLFTRIRDVRFVLEALVFAGTLYSVLVLIEIQIGPILHKLIYGFHQSELAQTVRFGGWRPKIFMQHGLNVAFFQLMSAGSAAALIRGGAGTVSKRAIALFAYLTFVLILCKTVGTFVYAAAFLPLIIFSPPRYSARIAVSLAALVFAYPALRGFGVVPDNYILRFFSATAGPGRAVSLQFRFANEHALLDHALLKPWFGWGGYQRNFVFDQLTGARTSTIDGYWIEVLSSSGMMGFVGFIAFVLLPIFRFARELSRVGIVEEARIGASLLLLCSVYAIDLIPNAPISAYLTFIGGTLAGLKGSHIASPSSALQEVVTEWPGTDQLLREANRSRTNPT